MSEQQVEQVEGAESGAASRKKEGGYNGAALRELRRARKLMTSEDPENAEANFAIATANVLALLDLASAIREHTNGAQAEAE